MKAVGPFARVSRERSISAISVWMVVVGIVLSVSIAVLTISSIQAFSRMHAASLRTEQTDAISRRADELVMALDRSQAALLAAIVRPGPEVPVVGAELDDQALQSALEAAPQYRALAESFLAELHRRRVELRRGAELLGDHQPVQAMEAVVAAGQGGDALQAAYHALVQSIDSARGEALAQVSDGNDGAFALALVAGSVGLLAVLAGVVTTLMGMEQVETLQGSLLKAQQALGRSERTRSNFLQIVGHDLRQPLQAMGLFATGLERRLADPASRPLLEGMRSAAASMNRMLSGLMDITRLDAGAVTVDMAVVQLNAVLSPIRSEFTTIAEAKGLSLQVVPCPLPVHTDPIMLESILRNLVSNAVRYTERGRVDVSCEVASGQIRIAVADTGPGIPAADIDNIFHDFYRGPERNRSPEGLGLGLGIVRRMANLLDITLTVASETGKGTVFTVSVPAAAHEPMLASAKPVRPRPALQSPEMALAGKHVMLVDDDDGIRRALRAALESRGMLVTVAASPASACAIFEKSGPAPFDIVLMDRDLQSTMNGTELLDHIASVYNVCLPALIISGTTDFQVVQELQDSGYPWVAKPIPIDV
eukprot:gene12531-12620_t